MLTARWSDLGKMIMVIIYAIIIGLLFSNASALNASGNTTIDSSYVDVTIYDLTEKAPFILVNTSVLHHFAFLDRFGNSVENIYATIKLGAVWYNLSYNPSFRTYDIYVYYNYSDIGNLPYIVSGSKPYHIIPSVSGTYYIRDFIMLGFNLYKSRNMTSIYDNGNSYIFLVPHNKSKTITRIPELAQPLEYVDQLWKTKLNRFLYLDDRERINSVNEGFYARVNTKGTTYMLLPVNETFSAYLIAGKDIRFFNQFYSGYNYESLTTNTYLTTDKPSEAYVYDIYVSSYDINPFATIVRWILWIVAGIIIIIVPIVVGVRQGRPYEAMMALLILGTIIPLITWGIDSIIRWIFI